MHIDQFVTNLPLLADNSDRPKGAEPRARVPTQEGFVQSSEEHGDNSPAGRHLTITQPVQNSSRVHNVYRLSDDDSELSSPPDSDDGKNMFGNDKNTSAKTSL